MPDPYTKGQESISQAEHISPGKTGDNIEAKRVVMYGFDGNDWQRMSLPFISTGYDYVGFDYPTVTQEVYTFKVGGASGDVVATVTVVYLNSTKEYILSVART